ncbi:hypothetical protein [Arthrobacter sp. U41]|uniref:hypothetical protein n=1 Tax=Arthrobacter sp. U41 TaxID=1849032 RepID=UPI0037C169FF
MRPPAALPPHLTSAPFTVYEARAATLGGSRLLRLALIAAGLPEPELQLRMVPGDPHSPAADLGYRSQRIAIQYNGGHHLTREQQSRDNRRDETFNAAGWRYLSSMPTIWQMTSAARSNGSGRPSAPVKRRLPYHLRRSNRGFGDRK